MIIILISSEKQKKQSRQEKDNLRLKEISKKYDSPELIKRRIENNIEVYSLDGDCEWFPFKGLFYSLKELGYESFWRCNIYINNSVYCIDNFIDSMNNIGCQLKKENEPFNTIIQKENTWLTIDDAIRYLNVKAFL